MRFPKLVRSGSTVVKVYRTKHKSTASGYVFQVGWHVGGVRKIQQFANEAEALEEARLRAAQLASGRIEAAAIDKPDRDELQAARAVVAGKGQVLPALREWAKAYQLTGGQIIAAAEAWKARNRAAIQRVTVDVALTRFLAEKKRAGYQTEDNHGSIFESLREAFGENQIAQVSAGMLDRYLAKIANPVTRNTHRKRIVTLWRWGQAKNYLPRDTKTEAEQTTRAREAAPVVGIISSATFASWLELVRANPPAGGHDDLPAIVLSGFCGMRRSEVHGQTWEDIDLARKIVRVTKAKRGTPARRLIPLSDAAVEWLMLARDRKGDVCTGMAVDRVRKLGIEKELTLPDNCLRHSYITHRVAATGNVPQTALDAGNSVQIIHRHYRELVTQQEGEAWFKIRPGEAAPLLAFRKNAS